MPNPITPDKPIRLHYYQHDLDSKGEAYKPDFSAPPQPDHLLVAPPDLANLVSSRCHDGTHMPALDIDRIPVRVYPSSTEGNFHLYIDKAMSWDDYQLLLLTLMHVGIIERSYYEHSIRKQGTFLRRPGHFKPKPPSPPFITAWSELLSEAPRTWAVYMRDEGTGYTRTFKCTGEFLDQLKYPDQMLEYMYKEFLGLLRQHRQSLKEPPF